MSGNCRTTICACISPSLVHFEETFSTLLFASRAIKINSQVQKNEKVEMKVLSKNLNSIKPNKGNDDQINFAY